MKAYIELTDLFGGEANYSWVRRDDMDVKEGTKTREIIRNAKRLLGVSGRGSTIDYGDMLEHKMDGTIMFITFGE